MKQIKIHDLFGEVSVEDIEGKPIKHTHEPFISDYLCLHRLIQIHKPKTFLEVGTHIGEGTNIICNAKKDMKVFSLDLPTRMSDDSKQHPIHKKMIVGAICKLPYTQLWGDSMKYPYGNYPCEGWFIDGEHDYKHPYHETKEAIKQKAKLIVWHDADIPEVFNAITEAFVWNNDYQLFRVTETAIAYAVRKASL